jgi:hypothetical protein
MLKSGNKKRYETRGNDKIYPNIGNQFLADAGHFALLQRI